MMADTKKLAPHFTKQFGNLTLYVRLYSRDKGKCHAWWKGNQHLKKTCKIGAHGYFDAFGETWCLWMMEPVNGMATKVQTEYKAAWVAHRRVLEKERGF